ncbi:MAG: hypothetical protein KJ971_06335 [Firmicutes bacterium]|nr:hypothetical protein [Bacillota bacterium]
MAKNRDIISYVLNRFPAFFNDHKTVQTAIDLELSQVLENYKYEIERIRQNYESFEADHFNEFILTEMNFHKSIDFVNEEYHELFQNIEEDIFNHEEVVKQSINEENDYFNSALQSIEQLKHDAYLQFLELTKNSDEAIDKEMKVHHDFLKLEQKKYDSLQNDYQEINSEQANILLWTIEKSKNALIALKKQLNKDSSNQAQFMNESVLQVIEALRNTKNKMNALFKSSSDIYTRQKARIEGLSHQRQKPHSLINQTIIHQFVKQIKDVNQKKNSFEKLIQKEYKETKEIIGRKIIESDKNGQSRLTEKYIMQYEIIQNKANYLLKRNQSMADLLISKYQNEIKKIKIDSFKRVEEIKLAYYMPAAFFQNSINLYSNFAFYVNESFDELDNILAEFIQFNQQITEMESNYITQSAKTLEDYKINVMVRVNNITSTLTDLITQIDFFSKEIVTLESNNQLEVASIRKRMENTDISGDYNKYLAELKEDEFFAKYQHDINLKKIESESNLQNGLISIHKESTFLHLAKQHNLVRKDYLLNLNQVEKKIHELAYDKDLAYAKAVFERAKALDIHQMKYNKSMISYEINRLNYQYAIAFENYKKQFSLFQQEGSNKIVDFVHQKQLLIDQIEADKVHVSFFVENSKEDRTYAYYLETLRYKLIHEFDQQTSKKTALAHKDIQTIHHEFRTIIKSIHTKIDLFMNPWKTQLLHQDKLSDQTIILPFMNSRSQMHSVVNILNAIMNDCLQLTQKYNYLNLNQSLSKWMDQNIIEYVINASSAQHFLQKNTLKPVKQNTIYKEYLIESIILFKKIYFKLYNVLDSTELLAIKNDVLFVSQIYDKASETKNIINNQYDRLVYEAVKSGKNRAKQLQKIKQDSFLLETKLKDQVIEMNKAFERSTRIDSDEYEYLETKINQIIQKNQKLLKHKILLYDKSHKRSFNTIDNRFHMFETAYQRLKSQIELDFHLENEYIESLAINDDQISSRSLSKLEQEISILPITSKEVTSSLEATKLTLIQERRLTLLQEFAHIEETKFVSRPQFLLEIEDVKKRLPSDYLEIYKKIQLAEETFLKQYTQSNQDHLNDYLQFYDAQSDYHKIIEEGNLINLPFDKYYSLQESLYKKSIDAYKDTLTKAKNTKDAITLEETKSSQKQDRIINV